MKWDNTMKIPALLIVVFVFCTCSPRAQDMFDARGLTFDSAQQGFPTWSPDGDSIVYQYTDLNDTTGKNGLWKISPDGSGAKLIIKGIAEHPQWSPDGRFIVFDADTGKSIKMVPAEGGRAIMFLPDTVHINKGGLPCWSPDASQIAFKDSKYALCIYNIKTSKLNRIFHKENTLLLPGCWSHDGKSVLIALKDRKSKKSTIWEISSDGKERKQITGHHENFYRYLALSPDGQFLVYAAKEGRYLGLYIMPAEGGNSLPLAVTSQGLNEGASWSPDGQKIAFTSTRSGNYDIWIMDLNIEQINKKLHPLNE